MKPAIEQIRDLTAELAKATATATAAEERAKVAEADLKNAIDESAKLSTENSELSAKVGKLESENVKLRESLKVAETSAEAKAAELVATRMGVDLSKSPDAAAAKPDEKPKPTGRALVEASIADSFARMGVKFN